MQKTFEIDAEIIEKVMKITRARSKKKAIEIAMKEFLRAKRREELSNLIGDYEEFALNLEDLERMRIGS